MGADSFIPQFLALGIMTFFLFLSIIPHMLSAALNISQVLDSFPLFNIFAGKLRPDLDQQKINRINSYFTMKWFDCYCQCDDILMNLVGR